MNEGWGEGEQRRQACKEVEGMNQIKKKEEEEAEK